ncbi:MAG: ArsR/SmtB family transcription factor [Candidatus Fimimonas sp.]
MDKQRNIDLFDKAQAKTIATALASDVRLDILNLLCARSMSVKEIAHQLNIPLSTASANIIALQNSDLIMCIDERGIRGSQKLCCIKYEKLQFNFRNKEIAHDTHTWFTSMPIGNFSDCNIYPTCGIASETEFIGRDDDVKSFYLPNKVNAQLIWFSKGFLEYRFPMMCDKATNPLSIDFSLECCSEAPNFRFFWPSDISVWINGVDVGTFTCPGDFGGRRGQFTPKWWPINSTQYGMLTSWMVNKEGSFINGKKCSSVNIDNLKLTSKDYVSFKIGIKDDATNMGGINIFGRKFGDYNQDISMILSY